MRDSRPQLVTFCITAPGYIGIKSSHLELRSQMAIRLLGMQQVDRCGKVRTFRPGRRVSGFRTGPLGLGHAVVKLEKTESLLPFYRDLLGFKVSDLGSSPTSFISFTSTAASQLCHVRIGTLRDASLCDRTRKS